LQPAIPKISGMTSDQPSASGNYQRP